MSFATQFNLTYIVGLLEMEWEDYTNLRRLIVLYLLRGRERDSRFSCILIILDYPLARTFGIQLDWIFSLPILYFDNLRRLLSFPWSKIDFFSIYDTNTSMIFTSMFEIYIYRQIRELLRTHFREIARDITHYMLNR